MQTMTQIPLFGGVPVAAGELAKRAGAAKVLKNQHDIWREAVHGVILELARRLPELTAEHVREEALRRGIEAPYHHNAWGAAMLAAAHQGAIFGTGRVVKAARPGAHARSITVWGSRLCRQGGAA